MNGTYDELQEKHREPRIAHQRVLHGTASAPFVPAQGLRAPGNSLSPHPRPLSTAVLTQTTGKLPKHPASVSAKSRDVFGTGEVTGRLWHWGSHGTSLALGKSRDVFGTGEVTGRLWHWGSHGTSLALGKSRVVFGTGEVTGRLWHWEVTGRLWHWGSHGSSLTLGKSRVLFGTDVQDSGTKNCLRHAH